jgi:hypothetical protein
MAYVLPPHFSSAVICLIVIDIVLADVGHTRGMLLRPLTATYPQQHGPPVRWRAMFLSRRVSVGSQWLLAVSCLPYVTCSRAPDAR